MLLHEFFLLSSGIEGETSWWLSDEQGSVFEIQILLGWHRQLNEQASKFGYSIKFTSLKSTKWELCKKKELEPTKRPFCDEMPTSCLRLYKGLIKDEHTLYKIKVSFHNNETIIHDILRNFYIYRALFYTFLNLISLNFGAISHFYLLV